MAIGEQNSTKNASAVKVLLVDDSAVVRGLIKRVLDEDKEINVIHAAVNGQDAINSLKKIDTPDIILLDVEMPVMDGLTALPLLLKQSPQSRVIMCSTLTTANADATIKALALGAADTLAKPQSAGNIINSQEDFKSNLLDMVKQIGRSARLSAERKSLGRTAAGTALVKPLASVVLRDPKTAYVGKPAVLAIGSSTGGPQALFKVLESCKGLDVPIFITQHMPPTFTAMLATHITSNTGIKATEGETGMIPQPGHVYIAPGGRHMEIHMIEGKPTIKLTDDPPENFCRPAVDPMFRSLLKVYGNKMLAVILTGMGSDGLKSSRTVVEQGGRLFAQDEASSVVWGMPGAVATAGICHAVVPLADMGPLIQRTVMMRKL